MRRALGQSLALAFLGATVLTGCGSGTGTATDRPGAGAGARQVALLTLTAANGEVSQRPTRLDTPAAVDRFTAQFRDDRMAHVVAKAVRRADVPAGRVLLGAVVALGCDTPPGVRVEGTGTALRIVPEPVRSPHEECVAAMTTVAIVSVPSGAL